MTKADRARADLIHKLPRGELEKLALRALRIADIASKLVTKSRKGPAARKRTASQRDRDIIAIVKKARRDGTPETAKDIYEELKKRAGKDTLPYKSKTVATRLSVLRKDELI